MANSTAHKVALTKLQLEIITDIRELLSNDGTPRITLDDELDAEVTTETYGLSSHIKIQSIDIMANKISGKHDNDEECEFCIIDLTTDDIISILEAVEKKAYSSSN